MLLIFDSCIIQCFLKYLNLSWVLDRWNMLKKIYGLRLINSPLVPEFCNPSTIENEGKIGTLNSFQLNDTCLSISKERF